MKLRQEEQGRRQVPAVEQIKRAIAVAIVLALMITLAPSPARAAWQDKSGSLPGFVPTGAVVGASIALGVVIAVVIYSRIKRRGTTRIKIDAPPVRFDNLSAGQTGTRSVPVTNQMSEPITVKSLAIQGSSNAFSVSDPRPVPFTMAPGEKVEIPVTLSAGNSSGKAKLRLIASAPSLKKDAVAFVSLSYDVADVSRLKKMLHAR